MVATAGTTVLGAFDPIDEIADLCQEFSCWLHVDAAWGGAVLISQKHRQLMKGNCRLANISKQLLNYKGFRVNLCRDSVYGTSSV